MSTEKLSLWSLRITPARGKHFVHERNVTLENAHEWLAIFRKDEPGVLFVVEAKKPKVPKA